MLLTRGENDPWSIQIDPVNDTSAARAMRWIAGGGGDIATPAVIQAGVWPHVAVVQAWTNASVFLNGETVAQGVGPLIPLVSDSPPVGILIGKRGDGYNLKGSQDDVAIFKRVLTAGELQGHRENGVTDAGDADLIALWRFNETCASSPAADASSNQLD